MLQAYRKYKEIKGLLERNNLLDREFTRKDFDKVFKGRKLITIETLRSDDIVKVMRTELFEKKLDKPLEKKKTINGVIVNNWYFERAFQSLTKEELDRIGVRTENVDTIQCKRYFYKVDSLELEMLLKKLKKETISELTHEINRYEMLIDTKKRILEEIN